MGKLGSGQGEVSWGERCEAPVAAGSGAALALPPPPAASTDQEMVGHGWLMG
jgi:hypothetical protein